MRELDALFRDLDRSTFRSRFRLDRAAQRYVAERTLTVVLRQGWAIIDRRLAPAQPENDGRQTPMRGHPIFVAQHATATCCRGCLRKWHQIEPGRPLSDQEVAYVLRVIERWLRQAVDQRVEPRQRRFPWA